MAEVVSANLRHAVYGHKHVLYADLSSVDDGETFTTGFSKIDSWQFVPATAVAVGGTVSGGTITIKVAAGTLAGQIRVEGE